MTSKLKEYIIDVGMHDGNDAEYYALRGFKVIAFEANPQLSEAARARFEESKLDIKVRNCAISDTPGIRQKLFVNRSNLQWSSLKKALGERNGGADEVEVECVDLGEQLLAQKDQIHMIKIDIEGFDRVAVLQLEKSGIIPDYLSVENGSVDFLNSFLRMGYKKFKLSNQKYISSMKLPKYSKHGKQIEWNFHPHSSGPFGNDIPSPWLEEDRMREIIAALDAGRNKTVTPNLWGESVGWFDMHASLEP